MAKICKEENLVHETILRLEGHNEIQIKHRVNRLVNNKNQIKLAKTRPHIKTPLYNDLTKLTRLNEIYLYQQLYIYAPVILVCMLDIRRRNRLCIDEKMFYRFEFVKSSKRC